MTPSLIPLGSLEPATADVAADALIPHVDVNDLSMDPTGTTKVGTPGQFATAVLTGQTIATVRPIVIQNSVGTSDPLSDIFELSGFGVAYTATRYGAHTLASNFTQRKSRGTALGTLAKVIAGDFLGQWRVYGVADDNATWSEANRVDVIVPTAGVPAGQTWVAGDRVWSTRNLAGVLAERMRLTSEGMLGIGIVAPQDYFTVAADAIEASIGAQAYSNTAIAYGKMTMRRARGTQAVPLDVQVDDRLGRIAASGYLAALTPNHFSTAANIWFEVDAAPSGIYMPGRIRFETTTVAGVQTEAMRIDSTQQVTVGTSTRGDTTSLALQAAAGFVRELVWKSGLLRRWSNYADNSTETGSNVGSDLVWSRYNDAGAFLGTPLSISRETGVATFTQRPLFSTGIAITAGYGITDHAGTEWLSYLGSTGFASLTGNLKFTGAQSLIVGVAAGILFRDSGNTVTNVSLTDAGGMKIRGLAGTGSRAVVAAADGTLSAP